ncbi:MAG: hypothetical protein H7222_01450 [Methylotenera sp.]|nr:hypothetical protein [Oligoflexia bacterium]
MTGFKINGVDRPAPVALNQDFGALIHFVHENMVNEMSLISSIRVNGLEISENDEKDLAPVILSDLESVEITFAHPREIAEDTLQTLKLFTDQLATLSRGTASQIGSTEAELDFQRLLDGIQTLADTVQSVKKILHIGVMPLINILEADLISVLTDLVQTHESKDLSYRAALLSEHLPLNLELWRDEGIPEMIRSRDS